MIVVVILASLLIVILIVFAYCIGVTVGEFRMEQQIGEEWDRDGEA